MKYQPMSRKVFPAALVACVLGAVISPAPTPGQARRHNRIVDLLSQRKVVLGWFAPARTPDAAKRAAADRSMDFVFLNMEQVASYDAGAVRAFMHDMMAGGLAKNRTSAR